MSAQSWDELEMPPTVDSVDPDGAVVLPSGAYRANLYVYDPFGRIDWYALVPQSFVNGRYFTLGRGAHCNITLNDGSVSTRHAYIASESSQLVLHDLQSTNGSLVNGERVSERALAHGDVIRLGATDVRFLLSYRKNPVHLVLDFVAGANAGKSIATYGASTNIGRLNCAINLQGGGVAAQHVRIDAFGQDLLYVVSLHDRNETWLNGQRLVGIAAAREGDVLQIGEHEVVLRVVDDDALNDAVPQGDGTLLLGGSEGEDGKAPLIAMSAVDMAKLEAHLQDLPGQRDDDDRTALDMEALADELVEAARSGAHTTGGLPIGARDLGAPLAQIERTGPPLPAQPTAALALDDDDEPQLRLGPPGWLRWLLVPAVVALLAGVLAVIPIPQHVHFDGVLAASSEEPVLAPIRGRVEQVYFHPGDPVKQGDVVAGLVDIVVRVQVDEVNARIAALRDREKQAPTRIPAVVPIRVRRQVATEKRAVAATRQALDAKSEAFHRREVSIEALNTAKANHQRAEARLAAAVAEQKRHLANPTYQQHGLTRAELEELAELHANREKLEPRLRVPIVATAAGALVAATKAQLRVGDIVDSGAPVFRIVDSARLRVEITVPADLLGAAEGRTRATLAPVGFEDKTVPVAMGPVAAAAGPGGGFPWVAYIENEGSLRPGQKVRATVRQADISALDWLLGDRGL